jgi:predicted nucleotidyltransferase
MLTTRELILQLRLIKEDLAAKYSISRLALFGSFARGEQTETSDVDLWVEFEGRIGSRFIELADELEDRLGVKVDLVSGKGVKPAYAHCIAPDLVDV